MHDPVTLFKVLIVLLVVVYQGVQALRKKAKAQPKPDVPKIPGYESEPEPDPARQDGAMERIRTLVLGQAPTAATAIAPSPAVPSTPAVVVSQTAADPIRSLEPPAAQGIPSLRNLVLAQVILSPPPGARGGNQTGRSPLEFRR